MARLDELRAELADVAQQHTAARIREGAGSNIADLVVGRETLTEDGPTESSEELEKRGTALGLEIKRYEQAIEAQWDTVADLRRARTAEYESEAQVISRAIADEALELMRRAAALNDAILQVHGRFSAVGLASPEIVNQVHPGRALRILPETDPNSAIGYYKERLRSAGIEA